MELFSPLSLFYTAIADDVRISATHISLNMALMQQWNIMGGKNPFAIHREAIMKTAKISARCTYNKCLNNLQEYGYIKYLPSTNSFSKSIIYLKNYVNEASIETFLIIRERDFKKWVKEAVHKYFQASPIVANKKDSIT